MDMFNYFHPDKKYLVPMQKIDSTEVEMVECNIKILYRTKGNKQIPSIISCTKEGYENKGFYPEFFGWLIYTKKIIEKEQLK